MSKKIIINSLIGLSLLTTANSFAWHMSVVDELSQRHNPDMWATASNWGEQKLTDKDQAYDTNIMATAPDWSTATINVNNPDASLNCYAYSIDYNSDMMSKGTSKTKPKHPWIEVHDSQAILFYYDHNNNNPVQSRSYNPTVGPCYPGFDHKKIA